MSSEFQVLCDALLLSLARCGVNKVRRRALRTVPQHRLNHIRRRSVLGKPIGHHEGLFAHLGLRFALGFSVRLARNRACAERLS